MPTKKAHRSSASLVICEGNLTSNTESVSMPWCLHGTDICRPLHCTNLWTRTCCMRRTDVITGTHVMIKSARRPVAFPRAGDLHGICATHTWRATRWLIHRHQTSGRDDVMAWTLFSLLTFYEGNPPDFFYHKGLLTRSFDIFFVAWTSCWWNSRVADDLRYFNSHVTSL